MKIKTIFFCGHHSPYGMSHLQPLIDSDLEINQVVLATDERWDKFYESLLGKTYYQPINSQRKPLKVIKKYLKKLLPKNINYKKNNKVITNLLKNHDIPYLKTFDVNDSSFIESIKKSEPDLIISAAYPQIFGAELITVPSLGSVNCHPSLLPKYRGAHPHFWAIAKGEKTSGITAHFMTPNLDDGDIIAQIKFPIANYTYSQLYQVIVNKNPELVKLVSDFFHLNEKKATPQDLSKVSYFRNDREIHHKIFWQIHHGEEIKNLVRTEKAYCFLGRERVVFGEVEIKDTNRNLTNDIRVENGTIIDFYKTSIVIKAEDKCIYLKTVKIDNITISADQWAKKMNLYLGEKFT